MVRMNKKFKAVILSGILFSIFSIFLYLRLISYSNIIMLPKKPDSINIPSYWKVKAKNPGDYGLGYETVSFITGDGITLRGWFIPGRLKKGIILVHGFEANKIKMLKYCSFLNQAGFSILLFDLRYFGENQGKYCSLGYYEKNDVSAAVKFMTDKGIKDVGIVAESMGAVAAVLALKDERCVKCAVLDSPFSDLKELLLYRGRKDKGLNRLAIELVMFVTEKRLNYAMEWVSPQTEIKKVKNPVFIICGKRDQKITCAQCERVYKEANAPKVIWEADCGHTEAYDFYPQEYRAKVLEFLRQYL